MQQEHWSEVQEVGRGQWQFRFMLWIVRHLPLFLVESCTAVVCFFFYLGASPVRKRSRNYLKHVAQVKGVKPTFWVPYKHVFAFALSMMEKILGFQGSIKLNQLETQGDDLETLVHQLEKGEGAFLLCSHLGNMEMLRSLTGYGERHTKNDFKVFPVVDFSGTSKFNALLRELNPDLMNQVVDANSIGVDSAVWMKERIAEGNLVVIAGDRTSAHSRNRNVETEFLGETANFPEGSFTLAGVLNAPVYFVFAIRKNDFDIRSPYEMHVVRARTELGGPRKERPVKIKMLLQEYVNLLEKHCLRHPYQWYNFFNFWDKP